MGAFGSGFFGAVGQAAHDRAQRQHAMQMEQQTNQLAYQKAAIEAAHQRGGEYRINPTTKQQEWHDYTPDDYASQYQDWGTNAAKVYGNTPEVKQIFQKAQQLMGAATNHPLWGHPGIENMNQAGASPAIGAPPTASAAAPTAPISGAGTIPPPPGSAPTSLDAKGASDGSAPQATVLGAATVPTDGPAAVSSPTSALSSAPQAGPTAGKSAPPDGSPSVSVASTSIPVDTGDGGGDGTSPTGPSDASASPALPPGPPKRAASQSTVPTPPVTAAPPTVPTSVPRGTIPPPPTQVAQATPPANPAAAGAIPPAVASPTGQQMLNSYVSPLQMQMRQAEMANAMGLRQSQAVFEQQQAQNAQKIDNLRKVLGREPTTIEKDTALGIKLPNAMFTPHYNSHTVLADNAVGGTMVDGSAPADHSGQVLQQVGQGMDGPIYNVTDLKPTLRPVGNLMHAFHPVTGEDLGAVSNIPVKTGTSNSTLSPISGVVDGQTVQLPGHRSSSPVTIGAPMASGSGAATSSPTTAIAGPGAQVQPGAAATPTSPRTRSRIAAPPGATPAESGGAVPGLTAPAAAPMNTAGGRTMPRGFVQMGQATAQGKAYSAVMDPYRQIFGDPDIPGIPPVSKYAVLADNPESSNRIGTAVKLSMQGLDEIGDKNGGLVGMFRNLGGLPALETSAQAGAINSAIQNLTPIEREAYDRQMQMIGTLVGLRAITGASAAQGSVRTIMNEAPMFGINVADSHEFNRRLAGFAQQMYTASAKSPVFTTEDRNMFKSEAQHMAQLGYVNSGKKTASPATVAPPPGSSVGAPKAYTTKAHATNGHGIGTNDDPNDKNAKWFDLKTGLPFNP